MIDDLPAPSATSNLFSRALIILFGRGYVLIAIMALAIVPLDWLRSVVVAKPLEHLSDAARLLIGCTAPLTVGLPGSFLKSLAIVFVAVAVRQLLADRPIEFAEAAKIIRTRFLALLGVILCWSVVWTAVNAVALAVPINVSVVVYPVAVSLILMGWFWSLLDVSFAAMRTLSAFMDGLFGIWKPVRSALLIAVTFVVTHIVQIRLQAFITQDLSAARWSNLSVIVNGLVEAVFTTFLLTLLVVDFVDRREQRMLQALKGNA